MNNPFYYTPSEECLKAVKELTDWLYGKPSPFCNHPVAPAFREEIGKGKMFGVLVVEDGNNTTQLSTLNSQSYLAGYSGQICGRSDWPEFVPAVFDYLQPDGYFKQHEAEIVSISDSINLLQRKPSCPPGIEDSGAGRYKDLHCKEGDPKPIFDKVKRDGESQEDFIRRRQFENAELHRWKLRQRKREEALSIQLSTLNSQLSTLKTLRRKKSDDLQRWLFHHFQMKNGNGANKDLIDIFNNILPPAGAGECCEPKLLQYAFLHNLKPISMAMFWWGKSPKGEIRHHLHFYPACNSKCKPILSWMLQGIDVDPNPLESAVKDRELASKVKYLYEDDDICVICKPAGLLSVPGKTNRESVYDIVRRHIQENKADKGLDAYMVHRLDMATSGIMVIAKNMGAYHNLQKQFACHEIKKRYVAILERPLGKNLYEQHQYPGEEQGKLHLVSLPLRPDLNDRPRQMVDFEYGREAVTEYKFITQRMVYLWPLTGRTHQLRVHCASELGLNDPIRGDELYGTRADRLYLHAAELTFRHPVSGRIMHFEEKETTNGWENLI